MAATDFTLPPTDACYGVVEGYKRYAAARSDEYSHAFQYRQLGGRSEQLLNCCPAFREKVAKLRSPHPDPEALRRFNFPIAVFDPQSKCAQHPFFQPALDAGSPAHAWFTEEHNRQAIFWIEQFSELSSQLTACCVQNTITHCHITPDKPVGAALTACTKRWWPFNQPGIAARSDADAPAPPPAGWVARDECNEEIKKYVVQYCESSDKATGACRKELKEQQAAAGKAAEARDTAGRRLQQCSTVTADLGKEVDRWRQAAGRQEDLQRQLQQVRGELQAVTPQPGLSALAAFPAGPASLELALCGAGALLAGFLLGLPGRSGRRRLLAGGVSALLALFSYLALVALLPDTHLPHLLLALTGSGLLISLRTLLRTYVLPRQRRQAAAAP